MNDVYLIKVSTDDYEALYINGKCKFSEHRLDLSIILESLIGYKILNYTRYYIESEIMESKYGWDFPDRFDSFNEEDLIK